MNRVVIVTGGSGGLGSAMAKAFGADGDRVVVNYNRSKDDAEKVVREIEGRGGTAIAFKADVANYAEVKAMVGATVARWGSIDVVINNAGGILSEVYRDVIGAPTSVKGTLIVDMSEEEWDWHINSNLKGAFHLVKAAGSYMIKQQSGHILNVVSTHAWTGRPGRGAYAAAKAGMVALTKTTALELGKYNIRVNSVQPGPRRVPRLDALITPSVEKTGALGEWSTPTPEEFAEFVLFVSKTKNVSGQLFNVENRITI